MNGDMIFLVLMAVFEVLKFYWKLFEEGYSEFADSDGVGEFSFVSLVHFRIYNKWKISTAEKRILHYFANRLKYIVCSERGIEISVNCLFFV